MPDQRYRVLFVASHPVQYQAPVFRRLAAEQDVDIDVAYCSLKGAQASSDPEFGVDVQWDVPLLDGYRWSEVPNRGSGKESFLGLCNPGLWKLIRTGNYDAVVSFVGYVRSTFWVACLAAKLSHAALLFGTDATSLTPRDGRSWKVSIKRILWPLLFRLADQIMVPSSGSRDLMLSLHLASDSVTLTPYCVENDWWMAQSRKVDRNAVRASWGIPAADTVILFSAKLQPWKRPLDLLRAFAKANPRNASLIFAGEGPLRPKIEAEAEALGVASRVRLLGFVNQSQLPAVYTASDLLVLPSEFEPFGVVVNEAMCCGCVPVATSGCGSARDLVAPVSSDLVFRPGDIDALAKILLEAASNHERLQDLARSAFAHIQTWSPDRNIAATLDAIRAAVARVRSKPTSSMPELHASNPTPSASAKLKE
ncbi:MAG TPA: glycosyltransferase family 4 protein [Candidatus Acidoferrum sp.]